MATANLEEYKSSIKHGAFTELPIVTNLNEIEIFFTYTSVLHEKTIKIIPIAKTSTRALHITLNNSGIHYLKPTTDTTSIKGFDLSLVDPIPNEKNLNVTINKHIKDSKSEALKLQIVRAVNVLDKNNLAWTISYGPNRNRFKKGSCGFYIPVTSSQSAYDVLMHFTMRLQPGNRMRSGLSEFQPDKENFFTLECRK